MTVGMPAVVNHGDWASIEDSDRPGTYIVFVICDDCREAYLDPPYYTLGGHCEWTEQDPKTLEIKVIPHDCTDNLCPACCGPYLEPDYEDDERRPH